MAKDAQIRARVDADLKEEAEGVLDSLGLSPTAAINMFYRQIVHRRGIPFEVALPEPPQPAAGEARPPARPSRPVAATGGAPQRPAPLTYGDFPQLFWSADPKAPLNLDDATTFARFLTRGDPETVFRVVTLDEIARRLPDLPLQPDRRAFWERVVRAGASG